MLGDNYTHLQPLAERSLQRIQKLSRRLQCYLHKAWCVQRAVPESKGQDKPIVCFRSKRHQVVQKNTDVSGIRITEVVKPVSKISMSTVAVQGARRWILSEKPATSLMMESIIQPVNRHTLRWFSCGIGSNFSPEPVEFKRPHRLDGTNPK